MNCKKFLCQARRTRLYGNKKIKIEKDTGISRKAEAALSMCPALSVTGMATPAAETGKGDNR